MGDENSNLGASKSLNFEIQPRNSQNHLFHGTLCNGLEAIEISVETENCFMLSVSARPKPKTQKLISVSF